MKEQTDEMLMTYVSQDRLQALSVLFDRYQVLLYNFFYYQNNNSALSEDLVQTVFERVLKYRKSYRSQMAFKSWIYRMARNVRNDHYQKNRYYSDFIQPEDIGLTEGSTEQQIEHKEALAQLKRAMSHLNEDQRAVLVMSKFQKVPYKEIAIIMQCSESAAKVKAHRALKALRNIFFKMEKL